MDENETGHPGMFSEGPQPLTLMVAVYNKSEVELMRALEQVVEHFMGPPFVGAPPMPTPPSINRAIDWLHAKYGTPSPGAAGGGR